MVSVQFRIRPIILWCVGQKTLNFYLTFLLLAAFKMLFCRVYCCFRVIVIKLISTIFNEMKQQLRWLVNSAIVYSSISSIFQIWCTFSQIIDSFKIHTKNHTFFISLKGCNYVMGGPMYINLACFLETSVGFLKRVDLQLFPKYSHSYGNLKVKSRLKI